MFTNLQATATFAKSSCPRLPSVPGLVVRKPHPPVRFVQMPPLLPGVAVLGLNGEIGIGLGGGVDMKGIVKE